MNKAQTRVVFAVIAVLVVSVVIAIAKSGGSAQPATTSTTAVSSTSLPVATTGGAGSTVATAGTGTEATLPEVSVAIDTVVPENSSNGGTAAAGNPVATTTGQEAGKTVDGIELSPEDKTAFTVAVEPLTPPTTAAMPTTSAGDPGVSTTAPVRDSGTTTTAVPVGTGYIDVASAFAFEYHTFGPTDTFDTWKERVGVYCTKAVKDQLARELYEPGMSSSAEVLPLEEGTDQSGSVGTSITIYVNQTLHQADGTAIGPIRLPVTMRMVNQNGTWLVAKYDFISQEGT